MRAHFIPFLFLLTLTCLTRTANAIAEPPAALVVTAEQNMQISHTTSDNWFPEAPRTIGEWSATDVPFDRATLDTLGNPPAMGYTYTNPFGEHVSVQMIAAVTHAAYYEPEISAPGSGYEKTVIGTIYPLGPGLPIRVLVLKKLSNDERLIMYSWVQYRGGATGILAALIDQKAYIRLGTTQPAAFEPDCIVRAVMQVNPADHSGLQARRDLDAVCCGLYVTIKKEGSNNSTFTDSHNRTINTAEVRSKLIDPTTMAAIGPDADYLTPPKMSALPNRASDNLLPLKIGDFWQMCSESDGKVSQDKLTVIRLVTPSGGVASVEIDMTREGAPWRKEFYSPDKSTGIFLTAIKDETSPLMVFNTPVPLIRYGFKEGDECHWKGSVRFGDQSYAATALSRISTVDLLATHIGKLKTCRIDTILTVTMDGKPIRFPSVRWLVPGVGFVRRAFADQGKPATSEVTQIHIR